MPALLARVEPRLPCQLLPQLAFGIRDPLRHLDARRDDQIAISALALGQAAPTHAQLLAVLRARRNLDAHRAVQCRHGNVRPQDRFPGGYFGLVDQVVIFDLKIGMPRQAHAQVEVAGHAATQAGFTAARDAQPLAFCDTRRNFHLVGLRLGNLSGPAAGGADTAVALAGAATLSTDHRVPDGNRPNRAAHRLFQRHQDVALDVLAASPAHFLLAKAAAPPKPRCALATP